MKEPKEKNTSKAYKEIPNYQLGFSLMIKNKDLFTTNYMFESPQEKKKQLKVLCYIIFLGYE